MGEASEFSHTVYNLAHLAVVFVAALVGRGASVAEADGAKDVAFDGGEAEVPPGALVGL